MWIMPCQCLITTGFCLCTWIYGIFVGHGLADSGGRAAADSFPTPPGLKGGNVGFSEEN